MWTERNLCIFISSGSVEIQVRCGGKWKHRFNPTFRHKSAIIYQHRAMFPSRQGCFILHHIVCMFGYCSALLAVAARPVVRVERAAECQDTGELPSDPHRPNSSCIAVCPPERTQDIYLEYCAKNCPGTWWRSFALCVFLCSYKPVSKPKCFNTV